jgi:hypothetical protein
MKKPPKFTVFVDGVDYQHELGEVIDGTKVYGTIEDLKERNKCWKSCGIVKLEITFKKWVEKQDLFSDIDKVVSMKAEDYTSEMRLNHKQKHLEYLEDLVEKQKLVISKLKLKMKESQ